MDYSGRAGHAKEVLRYLKRSTRLKYQEPDLRRVCALLRSLGDDDKANIHTTIDDEVLKRQAIAFRSTQVTGTDARLSVQGELTLAGVTRPLAFDVVVGDGGRVTGTAVVKQSDWGIKPYSTLFGALKVADDVRIEIDAGLPQSP